MRRVDLANVRVDLETVRLMRKRDSILIQLMSLFFWVLGRRSFWMERFFVAGVPFGGNTFFLPGVRDYMFEERGSIFRPARLTMPREQAMEAIAVYLEHEGIHNEQRDLHGPVKFALMYCFSMSARAFFEFEAEGPALLALPDGEARKAQAESIVKMLREFYLVWLPREFMLERLRETHELDESWEPRGLLD